MKKLILWVLGIIAVVIGICLVLIIYFLSVKAQPEIITKKINYTGGFRYANSGHLLINVKINGSKTTYPFILDNGAKTIIFENLTTKINLNRIAYLPSRDANKNWSLRPVYRIDSLELESGIKISNLASKMFNNDFFTCPDEAVGLIGRDIMNHFVWQFDFTNRTYTVTSNINNLHFSNDTISIPFTKKSKGGNVYVPITLNNHIKREFAIDLGSSGHLKFQFDEDSLDSLDYYFKNKYAHIKGLGSYGLSGFTKNRTDLVLLDSISIEKSVYYNVKGRVSKKSLNLLGLGFFKNFITTLDFPNKKLILEPYDSISFFKKSFGLVMRQINDTLKVSTIIQNSIADKLPIKIGDEVLKLNELTIDENFDLCSSEKYRNYKQQDTLKLILKRAGELKEYTIPKHYYFKKLQAIN